tara:strand:+ start:1110 stop:1676 length:567 start_codon:yes stop_codon:yes gene_type:complete
MWVLFLCGILNMMMSISNAETQCVCTTVPCPDVGMNSIKMGGGTAQITYEYKIHGDYPVVISAHGEITPIDLDHGTGTTSCTQKYSRILDDDGIEDCDAGHILANRLGGYGNEPLNIFPQDASINRGSYAQFENDIYYCIESGAKDASFQWNFIYENEMRTKPNKVKYSVTFNGGNCTSLTSTFTNGD